MNRRNFLQRAGLIGLGTSAGLLAGQQARPGAAAEMHDQFCH